MCNNDLGKLVAVKGRLFFPYPAAQWQWAAGPVCLASKRYCPGILFQAEAEKHRLGFPAGGRQPRSF